MSFSQSTENVLWKCVNVHVLEFFPKLCVELLTVFHRAASVVSSFTKFGLSNYSQIHRRLLLLLDLFNISFKFIVEESRALFVDSLKE